MCIRVSYYDLAALLQAEDAIVLVASMANKIIGSGYAKIKQASSYLDHEQYSYLGFMYTHPEYRGKGVNTEIVEELKKWSHQRGIKEIRLRVYEDNVPAIRAYEKTGFQKHLVEMRLPTKTSS